MMFMILVLIVVTARCDVNILITGKANVGKTKLMEVLTNNISTNIYNPTLSINKHEIVKNKYQLNICDTLRFFNEHVTNQTNQYIKNKVDDVRKYYMIILSRFIKKVRCL